MKRDSVSLLDHFVNFVIDRRKLVLFLYIIAVIFSIFSMGWVEVEEDIIHYLSENSNTRQGLEIMDQELKSPGMADVMISNISYSRVEKIVEDVEKVEGVSTVVFENTEDHYKNSSALFIVQFQEEETEQLTLDAMEEIRKIVEPYDHAISTTVGENLADELTKDMTVVGILATIVVIVVLIFTSNSYGEIPVLLITFGVAALLNMGTNFLFGKISFVSNSVAVVLQLALAIDYAIILCHRFNEERFVYEPVNAAKEALKKALVEISSSSLTTIAGLAALSFMEFGIGKDLSFVMIKAIVLSMTTVFILMPGLLVLFSGLMDKTKHRSFMGNVHLLGKFSIKTRYIMPPIFAVLLIISFILSNKIPFLFSLNDIKAHRVTEQQVARDRIRENFGENNMLALIVPSGDYESERKLLDNLSAYEEVSRAVGLANTEAMGNYMLTDSLSPRQFAELVDLDLEVAQLLYSAYAINQEEYSKIVNGINLYEVPLIDMYQFLYEEVIQGFVSLDEEQMEELEEYYTLLSGAREQMEGENYSRMILYLDLKEESEETFEFLGTIRKEAERFYDKDSIFTIGESSNALDLSLTFDRDNLVISILSVLFVILILTFTFRSVGLPILLISVIQASIWINFSFPYIRGDGLYFLGFLLVSSIQMGANIDYAIVITSRYLRLREEMALKEAVIEALNQGFPTVITSGTILAIAGKLIGYISTDGATAVLGSYLGQGTIISMILVIFVLPQLLYLGDVIIEKTTLKVVPSKITAPKRREMYIDGRVKGYVKGEIDATIKGKVIGEIKPSRENWEEEVDPTKGKEDLEHEKI